MTVPVCPVRGHSHPLVLVASLRQDGTGDRACVWECPTGAYRWFVLAGRELSDKIRMKRPRFGWRD